MRTFSNRFEAVYETQQTSFVSLKASQYIAVAFGKKEQEKKEGRKKEQNRNV